MKLDQIAPPISLRLRLQDLESSDSRYPLLRYSVDAFLRSSTVRVVSARDQCQFRRAVLVCLDTSIRARTSRDNASSFG